MWDIHFNGMYDHIWENVVLILISQVNLQNFEICLPSMYTTWKGFRNHYSSMVKSTCATVVYLRSYIHLALDSFLIWQFNRIGLIISGGVEAAWHQMSLYRIQNWSINHNRPNQGQGYWNHAPNRYFQSDPCNISQELNRKIILRILNNFWLYGYMYKYAESLYHLVYNINR